MPNCELVVGDGGSKLHVTILNSVTNDTIDLTGKSIMVRYTINGGATSERTMTALDQTSKKGQAEYQLLTSDIVQAGSMSGEVRLQAGQSDQLTTIDNFYISLKAPLP